MTDRAIFAHVSICLLVCGLVTITYESAGFFSYLLGLAGGMRLGWTILGSDTPPRHEQAPDRP